jgi:hypothetical protein
MRNLVLLTVFVAFAAVQTIAVKAESPRFGRFKRSDSQQAWHGQYYYLPYGQPTALVVPPNARMQQNYSWGVSQNTMTPIHAQFGSAATFSSGGAFYGTPRWPSSTQQFGVYPVRAPW